MAELTPRERLQPALLDRLTDLEPQKREESRDQRVLSLAKLRECVIRDLTWLLNADKLPKKELADECPEVKKSVLNYGMPSLSGIAASGIDATELEREIFEAIRTFEPRLISESITVRCITSDYEMSGRALSFEIEADLWAQPLPLHLYLQTELDLETGWFQMSHQGS